MTTEIKRAADKADATIRDLEAYISFGRIQGLSEAAIMGNVAHDLRAYCRDGHEDWFCPRTKGYANKLFK